MKVKLENGDIITVEWLEFWHDSGAILVGVGDDVQEYSFDEIDKVENE